ncbi:MAG: hypothetical protein LKM31_00715 [Sphingobium sp.]|jgi:2-oxoglutarate dehydrogenase E1 component|nr:hypothetical protein [Sphingobium sp.]
MTNLEEVVWCRRSRATWRSWFFVEPFIEQALHAAGKAPRYARALARAATGCRVARHGPRKALGHLAEQGALIADALGHSVRTEIKRQQKG